MLHKEKRHQDVAPSKAYVHLFQIMDKQMTWPRSVIFIAIPDIIWSGRTLRRWLPLGIPPSPSHTFRKVFPQACGPGKHNSCWLLQERVCWRLARGTRTAGSRALAKNTWELCQPQLLQPGRSQRKTLGGEGLERILSTNPCVINIQTSFHWSKSYFLHLRWCLVGKKIKATRACLGTPGIL